VNSVGGVLYICTYESYAVLIL